MGKMSWWSHRGLKNKFSENTAKSFSEAIAAGFTHLEADLRCSADGHIVISHDDNLSRIADENILISETEWKRLKQVQLKCGEHLLDFNTLAQDFAAFDWILDVKEETAEQVIEGISKWCDLHSSLHWLMEHASFLFWRRRQEEEFLQRFPGARTLARESECWRAGLAALAGMPWLGCIRTGRTYSLPARVPGLGMPLFRSAIVQRFHRRGASLLAFLPVSRSEIAAAQGAGFDMILVDGEIELI